jgi:hypothetical protein
MKSLLVFSLLIFLSSCRTTSDISNEYIENPCQDPEYLRLKKMRISEMTGAESEYFKQKEKECKEFSKDIEHKKSKNDFVLISVVIGSLAVATMFFLLFRPH